VLAAFLPVADETRGRLDADFRLAGSLAKPRIVGALTLTDASARIPQLGITLSAISLSFSGSDPGQLAVSGSAHSGGGELRIDGALALDPDQGWPLSLSLIGKDFELVNIPQAHVFVSPALQLEMRRRDVNLTGEVTVPRAEIVIRELPQTAVAVSNDVRVLGESAGQSAWAVRSRLRVGLGDKVRFQGFNLDARLGGELTIIETPGTVTTGRGEIRIVEGVYKAYGRKLDIEQGRLLFNGPIDSPRLDARAVRVIGDVTAGIRAVGPLRAPAVTVYSSPPLDQGDALSYVLIGRPLNQASGAEGAMLTQAAASLGMSGGEFLAKQIGERLGLEDVAIESGDTTEAASLVIGKYLSPQVYVSYGIGLFASENMFRLRYDLSRHLSLQAESGVQSGADLIYTFEYE
jgi:translocation and assembly module TamB